MNSEKTNTGSGFAYGFYVGEGLTRLIISGVTYTVINMFPFGGLVYLVLYHPLRAPIFVLGKLGGALAGGIGAGAGFLIDFSINTFYDYCFEEHAESVKNDELSITDFEEIKPPKIDDENRAIFFSEKKPLACNEDDLDELLPKKVFKPS